MFAFAAEVTHAHTSVKHYLFAEKSDEMLITLRKYLGFVESLWFQIISDIRYGERFWEQIAAIKKNPLTSFPTQATPKTGMPGDCWPGDQDPGMADWLAEEGRNQMAALARMWPLFSCFRCLVSEMPSGKRCCSSGGRGWEWSASPYRVYCENELLSIGLYDFDWVGFNLLNIKGRYF